MATVLAVQLRASALPPSSGKLPDRLHRAGAALGSVLGAGGIMYLGGAGAVGAGRGLAAAGLGAVRAGTAMGSAVSAAYALGQEAAGSSRVGAGLGAVARAAGGAARSRMSGALGLGEAAESGRRAAFNAMAARTDARAAASSDAGAGASSVPGWARAMKAQASKRHHSQAAIHTINQGDRGGHGAAPDIKERDD